MPIIKRKVFETLKVTTYEDGKKRKKTIKIFPEEETRGCSTLSHLEERATVSDDQTTDFQPSDEMPSSSGSQCYAAKRQKQFEAWTVVRDNMVKVRLEEFSPATFSCMQCGVLTREIVLCRDCGPCAYFCRSCCQKFHSVILFHNPCMWKEKMFVPLMDSMVVRRLDDHLCGTTYLSSVYAFDIAGRQHKLDVQFCRCEKEAVTLVRYGLWPATPECPRVAFDVKLMELVSLLQLEGHLAVNAFCEALRLMQTYEARVYFEAKNLYRLLVGNALAEYRFHRSQLNTMECISDDLSYGHVCPICTQNTSPSILCMDANFGLVHKCSAGEGTGLAATRHCGKLFLDQDAVNNFVSKYSNDSKSLDRECSNFQAGNVLRSKSKSQKLDVTGVFGSICGHEFPQKFVNLKHGERLAYPIFLLEDLMKQKDASRKVMVMYDIACTLHKHLKKNRREDIISQFEFAVPVFHSYAHNLGCQLKYGQRYIEGTGLVDGEGTERLWAYLRKFSSITKEMSLSNRQDLLVDSLNHYSNRMFTKLGERLKKRLTKASTVQAEAMKTMKEIADTLNVPIDYADKWLEELQSTVLTERQRRKGTSTAAEQYEAKLKLMQAAAAERQYLLSFIKKYADGQSVALRISKQLSDVTKRLQKYLMEVNTNHNMSLSFEEVSVTTSDVYKNISENQLTDRQMKAVEARFLYSHAIEEEALVKGDIKLFLTWVVKKISHLSEQEDFMSDLENRVRQGTLHYISIHKIELEKVWQELVYYFKSECEELENVEYPALATTRFVSEALQQIYSKPVLSDEDLNQCLQEIEECECFDMSSDVESDDDT